MFVEYKGRKVVLMSCSDCNTKCKHCYISYKGNYSGEALLETATKLMKNNYRVTINGTEPLTHSEFFETYKLIGQTGVMTNGLVFRDNYDLLDILKELGVKQIRISYHFSMHDKISLVPQKFLKELFKEITARGLELFLMCSITNKNYNKIPEFCKESIKLGAKYVKFNNMLLQGNATKIDESLILNQSQINEFFDLVEDCRSKYDKSVLTVCRCGSFGVNRKKPHKFNCPAGVDMICITPDKKAYPCVFLSKPGYEIGYYEDGKVYVDEKFVNNQKNCLALKKLNSIGEENL